MMKETIQVAQLNIDRMMYFLDWQFIMIYT